MSLKGPFARLLLEFGSESERAEIETEVIEDAAVGVDSQRAKALLSLISGKDVGKAAGSGKLEVSIPNIRVSR